MTDTGLNCALADAVWGGDAKLGVAVLTSPPTLSEPTLRAIVSVLRNDRHQLAVRRLFVMLQLKPICHFIVGAGVLRPAGPGTTASIGRVVSQAPPATPGAGPPR